MNNNEEFVNEITNESQCNAIAKILMDGGSITPIEALRLCKCFRLSARIHDLRHKRGMNIVSEKITTPDGKHVAQYKMAI